MTLIRIKGAKMRMEVYCIFIYCAYKLIILITNNLAIVHMYSLIQATEFIFPMSKSKSD